MAQDIQLAMDLPIDTQSLKKTVQENKIARALQSLSFGTQKYPCTATYCFNKVTDLTYSYDNEGWIQFSKDGLKTFWISIGMYIDPNDSSATETLHYKYFCSHKCLTTFMSSSACAHKHGWFTSHEWKESEFESLFQ